MPIKYHAQFLLDKEKDKPDARLRYRIKWNGNILSFSLGMRVDIDKWSLETQRCKSNTSHGKKKIHARIINKEIEQYENALLSSIAHFENKEETPSLKELKRMMIQRLNREEVTTNPLVIDLHKVFIERQSVVKGWARSTYKSNRDLTNKLNKYSPKLRLSDITNKWLCKFVECLNTEFKFKPSTIKLYIIRLKAFLRWAELEEYKVPTDYKRFKPTLKQAPRKIIFLDWEELMTIYNLKLDTKLHQVVRDAFCFCCFTGLRFSDMYNLRYFNVFDKYIEITTIKTTDALKIELNRYSRAILERYPQGDNADERVFRTINTVMTYNLTLKEIAKLAKIDSPITITEIRNNQRIEFTKPKHELVSSHCARRTFICNALMLGITPQIVMKWTGHSDYQAMKPYIDITDKAKEQSMALFDKI